VRYTVILVLFCLSCKVHKGYVLPSSPSVAYQYKQTEPANRSFLNTLDTKIIESRNQVSIDTKPHVPKPNIVPLPMAKKKTIKKRLFRSWFKRKVDGKERPRIFKKKKKTAGDYFNSKLKIGLVFLVIAIGTALIPVKTVPVIFGIASVLYLAWGLRKAFR
jgi:hypothetical protein